MKFPRKLPVFVNPSCQGLAGNCHLQHRCYKLPVITSGIAKAGEETSNTSFYKLVQARRPSSYQGCALLKKQFPKMFPVQKCALLKKQL